MIEEYIVVVSKDLYDLANKVQRYLKDGAELHGSLVIDSEGEDRYIQIMVSGDPHVRHPKRFNQ